MTFTLMSTIVPTFNIIHPSCTNTFHPFGIPWQRVGEFVWDSAAYGFFPHVCILDGRRSPQRTSMTGGFEHLMAQVGFLPEAFIVYFQHSTKRQQTRRHICHPTLARGITGCRDVCIYWKGARDLVEARQRERSGGEAQRYHIWARFCIRESGGLEFCGPREPSLIAFASTPLDHGV